jgi:hypothetical protein
LFDDSAAAGGAALPVLLLLTAAAFFKHLRNMQIETLLIQHAETDNVCHYAVYGSSTSIFSFNRLLPRPPSPNPPLARLHLPITTRFSSHQFLDRSSAKPVLRS